MPITFGVIIYIAKSFATNRFRSRSDQHPRYVPHRVENPSLSRPVEEEELAKMAPSEPRPPKPSTSLISTSTPTAPAPKSKKPKKRKASGRARNLAVQPTPAMLKSSFKAAFKTITQTVGSIQGCLRRGVGSRGVTDAEVNMITDRLKEASTIMNDAMRHVFRMVAMLILDELTGQPLHRHNGDGPFDSLDVLLEKESGALFLRNLTSLVLNGKVKRKETTKAKSFQAKNMAQRIFLRYKEITPYLGPVNKSGMSLGDVIMEFGASISLTIRQHFRKLPATVTNRVYYSY
jgi:hypothetical protein